MNNSVELSRKTAIAEIYLARQKTFDIIKASGHAPSTVHSIVVSLKEGNGIQRKVHSRRIVKRCTNRLLGGLKSSVKADPTQ